ncbi:HAD family hydrolase [Chitinimonas lacunae]|uniref:HAD family hydrolase n=1 Tax=Chitinimonas lacunae TaxID=1963018 RepID=A0ABV8MVC9_9NEIS
MSHANRAILFDLDDTLFDHHRAMSAAIGAIHAAHGEGLPFEPFSLLHAELLEQIHLDTLAGRLSLEAARVERFRRLFAHFARPLGDSAAAEMGADYRRHLQANRYPIDGAAELLQALRAAGVAVAVVSNNLEQEQRDKLAHLGLDRLIDLLVTSERVGCAKPAPAIFQTALRELDVPAQAAVMVGDNWQADVAGAVTCGLKAAWLNRFGRRCPEPTLAYLPLDSLTPTDRLARRLISHGCANQLC